MIQHLIKAHYGETCFLLGSGPSLNLIQNSNMVTDKPFRIIGVNEVGLTFIPLDYHFSIEPGVLNADWFPRVLSNQVERRSTIICERRVVEFARARIQDNSRVLGVVPRSVRPDQPQVYPGYNRDLGLSCGYTVAVPALHFALCLGFRRIILCGFDLCFHPQGTFYFDRPYKDTAYGKANMGLVPVDDIQGGSKLTIEYFASEIKSMTIALRQLQQFGVQYAILDGGEGALPGPRVTLENLFL